MDHQDAIGLSQAARERDGLLRVSPVVGHDELERQPADAPGGVDLLARDLGTDQSVLSPVHEDPGLRHDDAEPNLVTRQLRADGRGDHTGQQHGNQQG